MTGRVCSADDLHVPLTKGPLAGGALSRTMSSRPRPAKQRGRIAAAIVLIVLSLAVYARIGSFGFVNFDDPGYVLQNRHVLAGPSWDGLVWAFTSTEASNWHPLTWLSLMLDAWMGGGTPGAFHLTSLLLHVVNGLLVFVLFDRMTGATWRSALVAALFAVHPLHVESVAWIAERKDVLSTTFGLLALLAWVSAVKRERPGRMGLAVAAFAASLMAKPMLVSLPVLLWLADTWPLNRSLRLRERLAEKVPFVLLSAASCVVTVIAQSGGGATRSLTLYPLTARLANAVSTYVAYLADAVWPARLAVFYPYPYGGIPAWKVAVAAVFLAGMSWGCWRLRARMPALQFGWLWYLITLLPVIGLVQIGSQARADRYTYVPLIGPFVMAAWSLGTAATRGREEPARGRTTIAAVVAAGAVLAMAIVAHRQAAHWHDTEALFQHAVDVTEENAPAHNLLAQALLERGEIDRGLEHASEAARIAPGLLKARTNVIRALIAKGRLEEAASLAVELAERHPDDADAQVNLGLVAILKGRADEAEPRLREALRLDPDSRDAHLNLGAVLLRTGRRDEAISHFEEAVRLYPNDGMVRRALERVRGSAGQDGAR